MMKYVLLIAILLVSFPVMAQTPVSKETANKYFDNCLKSTPPTQSISQNSQQMLCACTAARLTQFFTMEDMTTMTGSDPSLARIAYNKMLIDIYAPCMEAPTREFHYNACITDPNTARYGQPDKICPCLANALGDHLKVHGPEIFRGILSRDPNVMDPMAALSNDPSFQQFAQTKLMSCLK